LSDYLFVLARYVSKLHNEPEEYWNPNETEVKIMRNKALLFINGDSPKTIPNLSGYDLIACTDGAFHYLKQLKFPLDKLDFISGDFDSHKIEEEILRQAQNDNFEIIETPDQNKTDFHKALEIIIEKGFDEIDVYGGSGGEQDHFLGNLSVAFAFKDKVNLRFLMNILHITLFRKNSQFLMLKGR
jgi:thiamine pyrophosphokinase